MENVRNSCKQCIGLGVVVYLVSHRLSGETDLAEYQSIRAPAEEEKKKTKTTHECIVETRGNSKSERKLSWDPKETEILKEKDL